MSAGQRQDWAVPVAQHLGEAVRLLLARGKDIDAEMTLEYAMMAFRGSVTAIGNIPGGQVQERVEADILSGMSVDKALRKAGC